MVEEEQLLATHDLRNQVIVVTGGGRGIGHAIVQEAKACHGSVAYCTKTSSPKKPLDEKLFHRHADVVDQKSMMHFFDAVVERFGKYTAVVINAGTTKDSLFVTLSETDWQNVVDVNFTGAFLTAQIALNYFLNNQIQGTLITIGSLAECGSPTNACYATTKGGLLGLSRSIAADYRKYGISTCHLTVGYIETALTANYPDFAKQVLIQSSLLGRGGVPKEVADVVLHLIAEPKPSMPTDRIFVSGGLIDFPIDFPRGCS